LNHLIVIGELVGGLDLLLTLRAHYALFAEVVLLDPGFVVILLLFLF
jgi:hypothetical protein